MFLHGLDGGAHQTWQNGSDVNTFWPQWLGEDLPGANVWVANFELASTAWRGRSIPIYDRGINLLASLVSNDIGSRPLIFITHSMGGLLLKTILRHSDAGAGIGYAISRANLCNVFFSTPNTGTGVANVAKKFRIIFRFTGSIKELQKGGAYLRELANWYRDWSTLQEIDNLVFIEAKNTYGIRIVDEVSGNPGLPAVTPIPLDFDHVGVCKFRDRDALAYRLTVDRLRSTVPDAARAPFPKPTGGAQRKNTPQSPAPTTPNVPLPRRKQSATTDGGDLLKCDFCGRTQRQVQKLIAGPGVYICSDCTDLSSQILDEEGGPNHREALEEICRITFVMADPLLDSEQRARELDRLDLLADQIRPRRRPRSGDLVAGAELVRVVGAGSFATVWQAKSDDGRPSAVKIFDFDKITLGLMFWRFQRGIRAMQHLATDSGDPPKSMCMIRGVAGDGLAFRMDYLPGGDLSRLPKLGFSDSKKRAIFHQVCSAVSFAHASQVVHRDIKPANIVLDNEHNAVLTDFDIADLTFAVTQSVAASLGSPHFASPEQLTGDHLVADVTADVFSLGKLLLYLHSESPPPLGWLTGAARLSEPLLADIHDLRLRQVIGRCIQRDPAARFQSVTDLMDALGT